MRVVYGPGYAHYKKVIKELSELSKKRIKVGILRDSAKNADGVTILEYAIYNEYGTQFIPARPFFREATEHPKAEADIQNYIKSKISEIISSNGSYTADQAAIAIGEYVRGKIIYSIRNGSWTPNAPSTLKGKQSGTTPLINQGDLIRSIEFEVV